MYNCRCRKCFNNSICSNMFVNCGMENNNAVLNANDSMDSIDDMDCDCGYIEEKKDLVFPNNPVLGQSYVPIQTMGKTYIPSVGLKMGTIFPELVMPYKPCQSLEDIAFIKAMNTVKEGCKKC